MYDAILIVSFGGPEGMDDVMPFLENVTRGRNIPRERLEEVAHHYESFGGVSPHNEQIRDLIGALEPELRSHNIGLPVYWGNRNWQPMLTDTIQQMVDDGIKHALAFVVSGYSSYSSCRQYRENIEVAQQSVGAAAPSVDKIRVFYNHPSFIKAVRARVREAIDLLPREVQSSARIVYTAHSIPKSMADACAYESQLKEAARLVSDDFMYNPWTLVYQSRSGPPHVPWLEPDVCDYLQQISEAGDKDVVIVPLGFLSDHLEVLYDLDTEAKELCERIGMTMARAKTVGTHPLFVSMIRELIEERIKPETVKLAIGGDGPCQDECPSDCCPAPRAR